MRLNLNETVKFKLTERGKELYREHFSHLPDCFEQPEPRIDEDGFTEMQLWMFMEMFGEHMSVWKPNEIEPLESVFDTEDSESVKEQKSMSVLIKNMEMPKCCGECHFCHTQNFRTWCCPTGREDIYYDSIPEWCPLEEQKSKLESVENATLEGEESTMGQPKSKLYIPLNEYTVDRINRLHKDDCGEYFDEEWLYNELEQIAEIFQLSEETSDTDLISRQAAIEYIDNYAHMLTTGNYFEGMMNAVDLLKRLDLFPPVEPKPVCEDAISKHDLWRIIEDNAYWVTYNETSKEKGMTLTGINQALNECPPVEPKPVMTEEVREALMRLTMCAREECSICKYENDCGYDKQVEMATENMDTIINAFTERPKGEWVEEVNDEGEFIRSWHCSNCYYSTGFYTTMISDFCPKCGADMRGDKE